MLDPNKLDAPAEQKLGERDLGQYDFFATAEQALEACELAGYQPIVRTVGQPPSFSKGLTGTHRVNVPQARVPNDITVGQKVYSVLVDKDIYWDFVGEAKFLSWANAFFNKVTPQDEVTKFFVSTLAETQELLNSLDQYITNCSIISQEGGVDYSVRCKDAYERMHILNDQLTQLEKQWDFIDKPCKRSIALAGCRLTFLKVEVKKLSEVSEGDRGQWCDSMGKLERLRNGLKEIVSKVPPAFMEDPLKVNMSIKEFLNAFTGVAQSTSLDAPGAIFVDSQNLPEHLRLNGGGEG